MTTMTPDNVKNTLKCLGPSYLVIDIACLFVAGSLREEVWLYRHKEDLVLIDRVCRAARDFMIRGVKPDRELTTYSGGEQAILACLLIVNLIHTFNLKKVQVLLCGVLESLSRENRQRLGCSFQAIRQTHQIGVHVLHDNKISEMAVEPCTF